MYRSLIVETYWLSKRTRLCDLFLIIQHVVLVFHSKAVAGGTSGEVLLHLTNGRIMSADAHCGKRGHMETGVNVSRLVLPWQTWKDPSAEGPGEARGAQWSGGSSWRIWSAFEECPSVGGALSLSLSSLTTRRPPEQAVDRLISKSLADLRFHSGSAQARRARCHEMDASVLRACEARILAQEARTPGAGASYRWRRGQAYHMPCSTSRPPHFHLS